MLITRHISPVLPGFNLTLGYTLSYLTLIILIPLAGLVVFTFQLSIEQIWQIISNRQVIFALRLSFITAFMSALINSILGLLLAWCLVRYNFIGKKIIDTMIDIPFALPTAIAGITLTEIYAKNGIIGQFFAPIKLAYTPIGIILALIFVTLPFVVRTLQPILEDLPNEIEEAAISLGASSWQTFRFILFPAIFPAWLTGTSLAFARGLGEYGSVIFIAGNIPMKTEILPLLIVGKLDLYDYQGAACIGLLMLIMAFILFLLINTLQNLFHISSNGISGVKHG